MESGVTSEMRHWKENTIGAFLLGLAACGAPVHVPPPPAVTQQAQGECVTRCQVTYAFCMQGTQSPGLATIGVSGILIALIENRAVANARADCAHQLGDCYQPCTTVLGER